MAVEAKRGCGYRTAGGLYLVSGGLGQPCDRLPLPLSHCPTCGEGVNQSRGFSWLPKEYVEKIQPSCKSAFNTCPNCYLCNTRILEQFYEPKDRFGLMSVGEKFYPTPSDWTEEASKLGVSKRIPAIPKDVVIGKTVILVAHPKAIKTVEYPTDEEKWSPGIFHAFIPRAVELVVTPKMKTEKWVKKLVKDHDIKLVEVPENDPDHTPRAAKRSARRKSMDKAARKAEPAE